MKKIISILILISLGLFTITGCGVNSSYITPSNVNVLTDNLVSSGYIIADSLVSQLKLNIDKNNSRMLVTSFVNINNLTESSTVGRMLAEHVASRLSQRGYNIIELRLRTTSVFMEEGKGEFLLSRDLREVSKNQNATAVVVGTYGEAADGKIYVSARIVSPTDSTIIASCDYGILPRVKPGGHFYD